jgi:membrane protein implicated in regulation of membrane protease activity
MTLPGYGPYPAAPARRGIGISALVLGILAVPALVLCGIGLVVALAGLFVGVIALVKGNGRGFAAGGMMLSVLVLAVGAVAVAWFVSQARECADTAKYPDAQSREECIERKFPFVDSSPAP